jgi:hypothetical protein
MTAVYTQADYEFEPSDTNPEFQIVRMLVTHGADTNARDDKRSLGSADLPSRRAPPLLERVRQL